MKPVSSEQCEQALHEHELTAGLIDCSHVCRPFEGAYTFVSKLCLLNVMSAAEISWMLFGKKLVPSYAVSLHAQSFLSGPWLRNAALNSNLAKAALAGALSNMCGMWAQRIAGDEHFRFCPTCLALGYQSSIHQIDALERCPVHGDFLTSQCLRCGTPTPRYALSAQALSIPMMCSNCECFYDDSWSLSPNLDAWSSPLETHQVGVIAGRLRKVLQKNVEWPDYLGWKIEPHDPPSSRSCRIHAFDFAMAIQSGPTPAAVARTTVRLANGSDTVLALNLVNDAWPEKLSIYKCIRRYVERRVQPRKLYRRLGVQRLDAFFKVDWGTGVIQPAHLGVPAELHAWALWRHRCESEFLFDLSGRLDAGLKGKQSEELALRKTVRTWPNHWSSTPELWGHFVWQCFLEDLNTSLQWHDLAKELVHEMPSAATNEVASAQSRRLLDMFRNRLSPLIQPWPETISVASWKSCESQPREIALVARANFLSLPRGRRTKGCSDESH